MEFYTTGFDPANPLSFPRAYPIVLTGITILLIYILLMLFYLYVYLIIIYVYTYVLNHPSNAECSGFCISKSVLDVEITIRPFCVCKEMDQAIQIRN